MGLKREHRETVDQIRKEHDEELFKIRGEQALPVQYHVEKIQQVNHKSFYSGDWNAKRPKIGFI